MDTLIFVCLSVEWSSFKTNFPSGTINYILYDNILKNYFSFSVLGNSCRSNLSIFQLALQTE